MIRLTQKDWRIFRRLQRKHKVSSEFLRYNLENIEKFIWFETWPRIVIKRYAIRKENRVFIIYYRLRRVLFDQSNRKMFKRKRQNIKQWSKRIVAWQKVNLGIKEYVEEVVHEEKTESHKERIAEANINSEDVSKQMKEQLKLLKNGRRPKPLMTNSDQKQPPTNGEEENENCANNIDECENSSTSQEEKQKSDNNSLYDVRNKLKEQLVNLKTRRDNTAPLDIIRTIERNDAIAESSGFERPEVWQINLESTPEKQITTQENIQPVKQLDTDEKTEKSPTEPSTQAEKLKTGLNFLDMLICKVSGGTNNTNISTCKEKDNLALTSSSSSLKESYQQEHSMDSTDEFLGFDDCERIPGMLMTPIVPHSTKNNKNSVFVSESLNEYMRINDLETNYSIDEDKTVTKSKIFARDMEGLMTPKTKPPHFDMPAVPENLLKFRTVAERKQYLQKFSKNYRLAIINNEASIYRELQRRIRTQKIKSASQMLAQSANSSMSFTRNGWNAASFINTEFNKYYYQIIDVDHGSYKLRLRGARGNNDEFHKTPYLSRAFKPVNECSIHCPDNRVWQYLKPIKTAMIKTKKLNKDPLSSVFKPCPLSHKAFQKPLDDDTAALLLAGGSMAVVRMPTVELEVFPEYGKPLHEIAKRYLQYILPHHDISREWAEFSVSTLQQSKSLREAEKEVSRSFNSLDIKKSFTFVIPYLNDRNHILVRRVVDRSEKLDQSFEQCLEESELVPKTDFSFRQNLNQDDEILLDCADVVSDMINTVAISCSENSFIKTDPDGLNMDEAPSNTIKTSTKQDSNNLATSLPNVTVAGGNMKKQKKQNSLLMELKRLNATIIDAAVKPGNDKQHCSKEFCQMGCICVSLDEISVIREHCGKTKCMLECTCKSSNQSRIMRLETDGRTLTTEDAFMLRRKATARLARMEKEFTSTIVLTENETLLINETNNDKKRRCTKAPKRYEDFTDTEDEQRRNSPGKKSALTTIDNDKHLAIEVKELHEPVYVRDSLLEQLKHCTVSLVPLQGMDNIAPWCMVHNLYKCFCKGRAVEGKPMIIEKEQLNKTFDHEAEQKLEYDNNVSTKAKYTFDKIEKKETRGRKRKIIHEDDDGAGECDEQREHDDNESTQDCDNGNKNGQNFTDSSSEDNDEEDERDDDDDWLKYRKHKKSQNKEKLTEKQMIQELTIKRNHPKVDDDVKESVEDECTRDSAESGCVEKQQKTKRSLHEVRIRFYQSRIDSCRRHIPTPRRMFLYCNRRRRLNVLKFIKENENEHTRILLNEHVMRSVYYHKIDIENYKKNDSAASNEKEKRDELEAKQKTVIDTHANKNLAATEISEIKKLFTGEVVDLLDDEDEPRSFKPKNKDENIRQAITRTKSCSSFEKLTFDTETSEPNNHFQICSSGGVITVKKVANLTDATDTEKNKPPPVIKPTTNTSPLETDELVSGETEVDELKLPKISSCFSLNAKATTQNPTSSGELNEEQCLDFTSAASLNSAAFSQAQIPRTNNLTDPVSVESTTTSTESCSNFALDMDNENIKDIYNNVIKTMNSLVSKKMQDIDCALQRESHIIPTPNPDILCIMKWCNFLYAFCEGFAYVWQVKIKDDMFFVVTIQNMMPLIMGAMGIVNITALKADKMPLIGRMLMQKFRNNETENLAVVMQGKPTHWVVKGFLKSDPNMACNKPTPESHPSLTKKINVLCSLLVKQRQKEQKRKDKLNKQLTSPQINLATTPVINRTTSIQPTQQVTPKIAQIMPTRRTTTLTSHQLPPTATTVNQHPILLTKLQQQPIPSPLTTEIHLAKPVDQPQKPSKQNEIEPGKIIAKINSRKRKADVAQSNNLLKMDSYSKMSSNIEFRSVTQNDINEIFLPELHKLDHKWLVLDLHNDFSHIFVPDFRDLVSLDRIQKVINFARHKSKIVKLQFFQNAPFDAFVTPKSGKKIYFGPLTMDMKAPTLILLQSVDGQMMLRELYQLQHNIAKKPDERTKAFWLIHLKGQTHYEIDTSTNNEIGLNSSTAITLTTNDKDREVVETSETDCTVANRNEKVDVNDKDDDDEDCMIIDDTEKKGESSNSLNITLNSSRNDTMINLMPATNILPNAAPMQPLKKSSSNNMDSQLLASTSQSLLKVPNTNTIIKPLNSSNSTLPVLVNLSNMCVTSKPLPILTLPPNTIITGLTSNTTAPTTDVRTVATSINIPTNAVTTGMKSTAPETSYSSNIFINSTSSSSMSSSVTLPNIATTPATSTVTISSTTTVSIPVENQQSMSSYDLKTNVQKSKINATQRLAFEAGAIKRRRISLFCSNKYDKMSENIAVDAVLRKILPDNAKDIQINPLNIREESNMPANINKVTGTVGLTRISKISQTEMNYTPPAIGTATEAKSFAAAEKLQPKAPIVFDVNFMDDGDEPTASIVIKPTSVTTTCTTTAISASSTASRIPAYNSTNTLSRGLNISTSANAGVVSNVNPLAPSNTTTSTVYKNIKLTPLFNSTTSVVTSGTSTAVAGKTNFLNSLLCTKPANIAPKFSTPRLIAPKLSTASSTITSATTSTLPVAVNNLSTNQFLLNRSLKVQKVVGVGSPVAANLPTIKPITSLTGTAPNATIHTAATLTVKQVQDMLNKPANILPVASTVASPSTATPLHILPATIKATIAPAKIIGIPTNSTIITPSATTEISSACAITTTTSSLASATTSSNVVEMPVTNSNLTISKVQSFGSPQKPLNTDKNQQTLTPPSSQSHIIIDDTNDQISTPPAHIQFGYIVSTTHPNYRFVAKRVADEFYVKVPSVGILKLLGLVAVNNYLNKYLSKSSREIHTGPAVWQFVAASKSVQMQNHQKSLLARKTKCSGSGASVTPRNKNNISNRQPSCESSLNEPILIDD